MILKQDLEMRFIKVKKVPQTANSTRNLCMRQRYGQKALELLHGQKRILNLDETWIGQTNFSRYRWQPKDNHVSDTIDPVVPRISMIAALDNYGDLYISLLQSNVK